MKVSSRWFLRHQARYNTWYVVCGLTPVRFAACPMFFATQAEALAACRTRGYELAAPESEELRKVASSPAPAGPSLPSRAS